MSEGRQRYVLFAMASRERGQAVSGLAPDLGLDMQYLDSVEELLFHTRGSVPELLVVDHALASTVARLDLVVLLRRRRPLVELPIIYVGPDDPEVQSSALDSGADAYLAYPPDPSVLAATSKRLISKRRSNAELRKALERLRRFEQEYRQSERVKEDLTHMLVHDLKSPVASIIGLLDHSLDLMGQDAVTGELNEFLGLARGEAKHLLNLTANILDVRRMKEGHMPYQPQAIADLDALAREALRDAGASQRQRNFSFLVRSDAKEISADPALLRRILANLLSNAVKHTRKGGYVDFRAWREGNDFVISIRDDGEGIPEADHKRIFNAFEQSRHTIHDRFDTGMGLTFCKLAVEKHGGRIWVESKLGVGSTFSFTIPVTVPEVVDGDAILSSS